MLKHNFDEVVNRRGTECKKWDTYAEDVIPMWIADTDFKCPQPIVDAMVKRAEHGVYGYPSGGKNFERAIQRWQEVRFGWKIETSWVEHTPAVVPGVIFAIRAFSHPGDHVVLQTPAYHPFHQIIPNNGRIFSANELVLTNGRYEIDFADLERRLAHPRAKIFLLCNPHNPGGRCFTKEELTRIGELCLKNGALVVSDEIHSDIVYKGHRHIPFASISEEFAQHSIVCVNPSKTFNIAGVRTGAAIIPNRRLHDAYYESVADNKAYGRTVFGTLPLETAYLSCDYYADQLMEYLEGNLEFLTRYMKSRIPEISIIKPEATYLIWLDCRGLQLSEEALVKFFMEEAKVAMNSGLSFGEGGRGFMRMNIACRRETLQEALRRIETAIEKIIRRKKEI